MVGPRIVPFVDMWTTCSMIDSNCIYSIIQSFNRSLIKALKTANSSPLYSYARARMPISLLIDLIIILVMQS